MGIIVVEARFQIIIRLLIWKLNRFSSRDELIVMNRIELDRFDLIRTQKNPERSPPLPSNDQCS